MADWNRPIITDLYTDVLSLIDGRLDDAASMFNVTASNLPVTSIRYDRTTNKFQEWDGAAWIDKVISVAGGGTGANNATTARVNLGLGTMAVQSSTSISVTGGIVTGLSTLNLSCNLEFNADGIRTIGTNAVRPHIIYIRNGLVIPVGSDKWVTS
jgi:hypothetical protein